MKRNVLVASLVLASVIGLILGVVFKNKDSCKNFKPMVSTAEAPINFYCGNVLSEIHEIAADINYKETDEKRLVGQELRQAIITCLIDREMPVSEERIRSYVSLYND